MSVCILMLWFHFILGLCVKVYAKSVYGRMRSSHKKKRINFASPQGPVSRKSR